MTHSRLYTKTAPHIRAGLFLIATILLIHTQSACAGSIDVPADEKNITAALIKARPGDTIMLAPGLYRERDLVLKSGITLMSRKIGEACLEAGGREPVITLPGGAAVIGCVIRNGTVGVMSRGGGNALRFCTVSGHRGSGIIVTACMPEISDCIITANGASGIQAIDIASGQTTVEHCTIIKNGNNAISWTGTVPLIVKNCILVRNQAAPVRTDAGTESPLKISTSCLYDNGQMRYTLPEGNFTVDPAFASGSMLHPDYRLKEESPLKRQADDGSDVGARFEYSVTEEQPIQ